jgi:hypothetical protein
MRELETQAGSPEPVDTTVTIPLAERAANNKQTILTVEGASAWAEANPDTASEIANKERPSRRDFERAGLPTNMSADERAKVSQMLKGSQPISLMDEIDNAFGF